MRLGARKLPATSGLSMVEVLVAVAAGAIVVSLAYRSWQAFESNRFAIQASSAAAATNHTIVDNLKAHFGFGTVSVDSSNPCTISLSYRTGSLVTGIVNGQITFQTVCDGPLSGRLASFSPQLAQPRNTSCAGSICGSCQDRYAVQVTDTPDITNPTNQTVTLYPGRPAQMQGQAIASAICVTPSQTGSGVYNLSTGDVSLQSVAAFLDPSGQVQWDSSTLTLPVADVFNNYGSYLRQ